MRFIEERTVVHQWFHQLHRYIRKRKYTRLKRASKGKVQFIKSFGRSRSILTNLSRWLPFLYYIATKYLKTRCCICSSIVLYRWKQQGLAAGYRDDWTPDKKCKWVKSVKDIFDDVASLFLQRMKSRGIRGENEIKRDFRDYPAPCLQWRYLDWRRLKRNSVCGKDLGILLSWTSFLFERSLVWSISSRSELEPITIRFIYVRASVLQLLPASLDKIPPSIGFGPASHAIDRDDDGRFLFKRRAMQVFHFYPCWIHTPSKNPKSHFQHFFGDTYVALFTSPYYIGCSLSHQWAI